MVADSAENGLPEFGGSLGTPAPADFPKPPAEKDTRPLRCRIGIHRRWIEGSLGESACRLWVSKCVRCGR